MSRPKGSICFVCEGSGQIGIFKKNGKAAPIFEWKQDPICKGTGRIQVASAQPEEQKSL
ncbi:MAG: hypothetical protein Q8O19_06890 [Rectinemataceae bacterium]|nr:hypothetical protein [Rectinemataceae bacterium]